MSALSSTTISSNRQSVTHRKLRLHAPVLALLVPPACVSFSGCLSFERTLVKATELLKPANAEEAASLDKIDLKRLPQHVAVIMDGNGRWAQRRHLPRIAGHRAGVKAARE